MAGLLDLYAKLEQVSGPVALATPLHRSRPGLALGRRLLEPGGATGFREADLEALLASGTSRMLAGPVPETGTEYLLERLVPGKLPPWLHCSCQVLRRGGACVLATVGSVAGDLPYGIGDHFVYDERNHGLLPMDAGFSLELQRACQRAREAGGPVWVDFPFPAGTLGLCLEPLAAQL